jgi:hypothetical protein
MKIQIFVLLLFLSLSCKPQNNSLLEIDPRSFPDNKITLGAIADDIYYVLLDGSIPIGINYKLKITASNIYLSVKDIGILKFDRSGRLICRIGSIGRGPGQYTDFMDYAVDELTGNIYVMGPGIIKVYSQRGTFVRNIDYKAHIAFVGGDIEVYNSLLFIPDFLWTGEAKNSWVFLDTLGKLVAAKKNSIQPFKTNTGIDGSIYRFGSNLYYYNLYNDTIFSISPDLSSKGAYLFAKGDHRWTIGEVNTHREAFIRIFKPMKMFESKYFVIILYAYLDRSAISLIEKQSGKVFIARIQKGELSEPSLQNDLDGALPFGMDINYFIDNNEEYLVQLISPIDLKTHVADDEFKNGNPKYPERKKEVESLALRIKETDNPLLMIARLKK